MYCMCARCVRRACSRASPTDMSDHHLIIRSMRFCDGGMRVISAEQGWVL